MKADCGRRGVGGVRGPSQGPSAVDGWESVPCHTKHWPPVPSALRRSAHLADLAGDLGGRVALALRHALGACSSSHSNSHRGDGIGAGRYIQLQQSAGRGDVQPQPLQRGARGPDPRVEPRHIGRRAATRTRMAVAVTRTPVGYDADRAPAANGDSSTAYVDGSKTTNASLQSRRWRRCHQGHYAPPPPARSMSIETVTE
jgi:hypothetical protein